MIAGKTRGKTGLLAWALPPAAVLLLSGCGKGAAGGSGLLLSGSAAREAAASGWGGNLLALQEPLRLYCSAGLGFIVFAAALMLLGGRRQGLFMLALGVFTTAAGVLFTRYPWVVLLFSLLSALALGFLAWDWLRVRREAARTRGALAVTVRAIEDAPEGRAIKDGIAGLGSEAAELVREIIAPIKRELHGEE